MINPTSPSPVTSPSESTPVGLNVTPEDLRNAADECRVAAAVVGKQSAEVSIANLATQNANRGTPLILATTSVCGDVSTSLANLQKFYLDHADALDEAAEAHARGDHFDAKRFDNTRNK